MQSVKNMNDQFTYIENDALCRSAIEELEGGMEVTPWLNKYFRLLLNVSYGMDGMPIIADCNFEGNHYRGISYFVHLYFKTQREEEDPF
jgi:hypothetical protein